MNMVPVTTIIPITTTRMPMLGPVTQTPPTSTPTKRLGMVITATPTATMLMPQLMPVVLRKLPGMPRELGIMPATPKGGGSMIMETMAMDTTADISSYKPAFPTSFPTRQAL